MNPTSILPSTILPKKGGNFFDFLGLVGKIRGKIRIGVILRSFYCRVGFLSFVRDPTPILPKLEAVEIMFSLILRQD